MAAARAGESPADLYCVVLYWVKTSAHTLAYAFILLALYPEEQEWVYQTIVEQLGDREPVRETLPTLKRLI